MSDSIKKWHEMQEAGYTMYPGDIYVTTSTSNKNLIYESPDGGDTVTQRPFGGDDKDREVIKQAYKPDSIIQEAISMLTSRGKKGLDTYKVTMDRNDLTLEQWLEHSIEEQADNLLYLIKALKVLRQG